MKKQLSIAIGLSILSLFACESNEPKIPSMTYTPSTIVCNVGDSIFFTPQGTADYVSFWSGEVGKDYYNVKEANVTAANFSFTYRADASPVVTDMEFDVYVSTDFTATYTALMGGAEAIQCATWERITDQVYSLHQSSTLKSSTPFDLMKYKDKPFFIAFRYAHQASQPNLTIGAVSVTRTTDELGTQNNFITAASSISYIGSVVNTNWYSIVTTNLERGITLSADNRRWYPSGTGAIARGYTLPDPQNSAILLREEKWLISPPIGLKRMALNTGISIKNRESLARPYAYAYKTKGTYKAVFVYSNSYLGGTQQNIQEITITVK